MAIAISELAHSRDGKGIPAREFEVREHITGRIVNRIPGLIFALNKKQGLVGDAGSFYGLPAERMQEVGIELMIENGGLDLNSGRKIEDETSEKDDITVFQGEDRIFKRKVCIDPQTGEQYRVRWFQELPDANPEGETPQ